MALESGSMSPLGKIIAEMLQCGNVILRHG
jgi:hypothetical protein